MIEAMPGQAIAALATPTHRPAGRQPDPAQASPASQLIVIYVCWRFLRLLMSIWLQGNYIHFVCIRKLVGSVVVVVIVRHKKWKIFEHKNNSI